MIDKTIVLPPAPAAPSTAALVDLPAIAIDDIAIDGGSILSGTEVSAVSAAYVGRKVSFEELEDLRRRLSLLYFDKGYVNSGVILPDQQVMNNTVHFREIRGELTAIQLTGNDSLRDEYILSRVQNPGDGPLDINALQSSLQLLEQDPMISHIHAQLLPGAKPGQGILRLEVAEIEPWQFVVRADNHRSPAVGGEQVGLLVRNRSLSGRGDELALYGSYADGYGDAFLSYSLPLGANGSSIQLYGSVSDSDIVEEPFTDIDIESETRGVGASLNWDVKSTLTGALSYFVGFDIKHNQNTLLGQPFSFTVGERDGETNLTVLYAGTELARRFDRGVSALRASFRYGLYAAGATQNSRDAAGPDGGFTSFLLQGQHIQNLELRDSTLIGRLTFQRAFDPLLPMEKLPMGGASTVRGHRENLLVRDNGIVGSVEWRIPLFDVEGADSGFDWHRLTLATFFDFGESWNNSWENGPSTGKQQITSAGLGVLWNPSPAISAEIYWGNAIKKLDSGGDDLQDDGFHLSFRWVPGG
jgi:hemolysin activation/secretion protein